MKLGNFIPMGLAAVAGFAILGCGEQDAGLVQSETRISVTISTTGGALDRDGYVLALGAVVPVRVSANGVYDFEMDPGTYTMRLTDVALNCSVSTNPMTVTATQGATVRATIQVSCPVTFGEIEVSVVTSGARPDSDGYTVSIPLSATRKVLRNLAPNDTVNLGSFPPGTYYATLGGIAANCAAVPATLSVSVGPGSLARIEFAVTCVAPVPGRIRFHGTTTGTQIPGLFIAIVTVGPLLVDIVDLNPNGVVASLPHPAGPYRVTVGTGPCTGGIQTSVNIPAGGYADVYFTATCP